MSKHTAKFGWTARPGERRTPYRIFPLVLLLNGVYAGAAQAQAPALTAVAPKKHWIEINAGAGVGIPSAWYDSAKNQSAGVNLIGSALVHLGWGLGVGLGGEWSRLGWTPLDGPAGKVDSWVIGPEIRFTDHHWGRVAPVAYLGLGLGGLSSSRTSRCSEVFGGPAARAGLGVDFRVHRRWRIGALFGVVVQPRVVGAHDCSPTMAIGDPGSPVAPGNLWGLRLEGGGDFLDRS